MGKLIGISLLLLTVCVVTALYNPDFLRSFNLENIVRRSSLFGLLGIGVAFVIITGGIDLSIGSVVGLVGCVMLVLLVQHQWHWTVVFPVVLAMSLAIGAAHGLLITKVGLQPFVVTLCGLLLYRGLGRWLTDDQTVGFGTEYSDPLYDLADSPLPLPGTDFDIPVAFLVLVVCTLFAVVFLRRTVWGRHIFAVGSNERAARYAGVNTHRTTILAYMLCSGLAGIAGMLFAFEYKAIQPANHGNFYELYAIAAAVLGGCSLRGGEGSVLGVVIGAATMRVIYNAITLFGIPTQLEFAIIGAVILIGVATDELVRRHISKRRGLAEST